MPDDTEENEESPLNLALAEAGAPPRKLRKRPFRLDRDEIAQICLERLEDAENERAKWLQERLVRYAKYRGWREKKESPWADASNQHVPVVMANNLRIKAGLSNAVLGLRPIMDPKVRRREHKEASERANDLIDYQVFMEADGESKIGQYIDDYVDEGTAYLLSTWVKRREPVVQVFVQPTPELPFKEAVPNLISTLIPGILELTSRDEDGYRWEAEIPDADGKEIEATIEVWDKDEDTIEIVIEWAPTVYEGPALHVPDLEDIVGPFRAENPQPVTPENPTGAPWVARKVRVTLDEIQRRREDGIYDLLTDEDIEKIEAEATGRADLGDPTREDDVREEKERAAGLEPLYTQDHDRLWVTLVEYYGAWDLNDDGLMEEAIFWIIREAEVLARARHLTEIYPGLPIQRPIVKACPMPVKGQWYGIGYIELQEGLHDLLHVIFNQSIDAGTLANQVFFFYRASSGLKPEVIRLWPGEGYPVDNPTQDVTFPTLPQRDQSWAFNTIGLGLQFLDRLTQIGPIQQGQVPAGKSSALRTVGTTMAILQQGAAMPEQVLRRLFHGLSQTWAIIHKLNTHYLPKRKEYLIIGKAEAGQEPYARIDDPQQIAVPVQFDFRATLLNTNKGLVQQALTGIGTALFNPLGIQMGTVQPENWYNWAKDFVAAAQLDPKRYVTKPPQAMGQPKLLAEEAISLLLQGQMPAGMPLEPPQEHLQKLLTFQQSEEFGLLQAGPLMLFREYLKGVLALVQQAMQQQALMQAAQDFAGALGNEGQGQKAMPTVPPEVQSEQGTQQELAGATNGGGP